MIGSIPGNYVDRLVLPKEPIKEQLMRAYEAGWSRARNDDGHAFDHLTPGKSLSEVSTRLMAFFPKEKIAAALKVAEQPDVEIANPLPVKEDAAAIAERMISHFAPDSPDELLRHIRTSIAKAQTIVGDRMAVAKKLPFGGDGFAIYERLRERSDETHAAEWFSAVLWALSEQIDGWEGELERLMEADARGSTDLPQPDERIVRYVAREKEVFQRFEAEGFTGKPLSEALFGSMVVDLGGNVPYRAYDGALINPAGAPDLAKNTFSAQAGVYTHSTCRSQALPALPNPPLSFPSLADQGWAPLVPSGTAAEPPQVCVAARLTVETRARPSRDGNGRRTCSCVSP